MYISASIVLYNNPVDEVIDCIESLMLTPVEVVYIIDNSPVDSLRDVVSNFGLVEYIHNPSNPGYGAAHNIGLRKSIAAEFEFHLIINADVCFDSDVLSVMLQEFVANNRLGAAMPRVVYPSGAPQELCKFIPTPYDLIARRFLPSSLREKNESRFKMMDLNRDKILFVPYLSGCFMLLKTEVLRRVGLFDERFFMYPEDIDLSRRVYQHYDTCYIPHAVVVHRHEQASRKSFRMLWVHFINMVLYFNKWGWIFDNNRRVLNSEVRERNKV